MHAGTKNGVVAVDVGAVWSLVALYAKKYEKGDRSARVGLESLTYLLSDTPIGDEVAKVWVETTGGAA